MIYKYLTICFDQKVFPLRNIQEIFHKCMIVCHYNLLLFKKNVYVLPFFKAQTKPGRVQLVL